VDEIEKRMVGKIVDSKIIGEVGLSAARGDLLFLVLVDEQGGL
jgi:hypothetical protein